MSPARLEARMDSLFSFPVGLFHPPQHAGLSRRSTYYRVRFRWSDHYRGTGNLRVTTIRPLKVCRQLLLLASDGVCASGAGFARDIDISSSSTSSSLHEN